MINKEKLEKVINEVIKKESILLTRPEPKKQINEEEVPEVSEDK